MWRPQVYRRRSLQALGVGASPSSYPLPPQSTSRRFPHGVGTEHHLQAAPSVPRLISILKLRLRQCFYYDNEGKLTTGQLFPLLCTGDFTDSPWGRSSFLAGLGRFSLRRRRRGRSLACARRGPCGPAARAPSTWRRHTPASTYRSLRSERGSEDAEQE